MCLDFQGDTVNLRRYSSDGTLICPGIDLNHPNSMLTLEGALRQFYAPKSPSLPIF